MFHCLVLTIYQNLICTWSFKTIAPFLAGVWNIIKGHKVPLKFLLDFWGELSKVSHFGITHCILFSIH